MRTSVLWNSWRASLMLALLAFLSTAQLKAQTQPHVCGLQGYEMSCCSNGIVGVEVNQFTTTPPPAGFEFGGERDVVISVTYNGFTTQAQTAFQYAVDIWASLLTSNVPIIIDATWSDLPGNTLGSAGANAFWTNFSGAPQSNTYYPSPLADKLAGFDLDPGEADIVADFDSGTNWYFGTDGNPGAGQFDFVSVVLHELGHGLGVQGSADYSGGTGYLGLGGNNYPIIYDDFVENGSNQSILSFSNPSTALGNQLTGNSLYWNGTNAVTNNGGTDPRLYAPSSWEPGSSYSHLNESTYNAGNANSLMTPQIGFAEAIHDPGPIILGLMADIGWEVDNSGGGDCVMTSVDFETICSDGVPIIQMVYGITGGCTIDEICMAENGGSFACDDISGLAIGDGQGINFTAALPDADYEFYFVLSDGTVTDIYTYTNGNCDNLDTICDCAGTEHTIGVLTWLGDGYADDGAYQWEGQFVDFNCATWGYDCGDIAGSPSDDPFGVCGGNLPPNNGCAGSSCEMLDVAFETICSDGVPIIQMFFSISGGCTMNEICMSENGGGYTCDDISGLAIGDGQGINFTTALADADYDFYFLLSDGTQTSVYSYTNGNCDNLDTICDCAGTEHTIGVLTWLGDGYADDGTYQWEGQYVDFNCATWGYDCGDIAGSPSDDPYGVCSGNLPPNNGCAGGGDCTVNSINVYLNGCGEFGTNDMQFMFDYSGDCTVFEICAISTFDAQAYCFEMATDLYSGDVWGITGLDVGTWEFYYTLSDGTSSPTGSLNIMSCVPVEGCTNPYATNYDSSADIDDGSCTYNETICDCDGNEHTIGVLVWIGDGFADDGTYEWDGQTVSFDCEMWGYDCGDIAGSPSSDPYNVCGGDLPPNNGCVTPGCTDTMACNYNAEATVDDGSCDYDSCAGCTNPSACNYDSTATLNDGSCEYDSCAGCTNPMACNFDPNAVLENGSCEFVTCAGCTDSEACNYDVTATLENGSCDYSCYGCTDSTALNYDSTATIDDGTCSYEVVNGCIDSEACNYDPFATDDDGSCEYLTCAGCMDFLACNYDSEASIDDDSCDFSCYGCTDSAALNYDPNATIDDGTCSYEVVEGCTDDEACNYDPFATDDDGSCDYSCYGCTDVFAINYDPTATIDDGSCIYDGDEGCTDSEALNYDPNATIDDGSCIYDCDYPSITYNAFCEEGEENGFYVQMNITDLGNGAPYLVTNNATNQEFEISFNGNIQLGIFSNNEEVVVLVSSLTLDGCLVSSQPLTADCSIGIEEINEASFNMFPNPSTGEITLITNHLSGMVSLDVIDELGKLVHAEQLVVTNGQAQPLNLNALSDGVYFVRMTSNENVIVKQLIINK
ncbi:MAG: zinc-dependent metalloprotease [Flavobacteriales bacterium]|nr:zinc-dependent metalloprotease [Flavobacteriales bacterium]